MTETPSHFKDAGPATNRHAKPSRLESAKTDAQDAQSFFNQAAKQFHDTAATAPISDLPNYFKLLEGDADQLCHFIREWRDKARRVASLKATASARAAAKAKRLRAQADRLDGGAS